MPTADYPAQSPTGIQQCNILAAPGGSTVWSGTIIGINAGGVLGATVVYVPSLGSAVTVPTAIVTPV